MDYVDYVKQVLRDRGHERKNLLEQNVLRAEASLPLYDIDEELKKMYPLLSEEEFLRQADWFKFRAEEWKKLPTWEETYESYGRDAKRTANAMQIRDAKIRADWDQIKKESS